MSDQPAPPTSVSDAPSTPSTGVPALFAPAHDRAERRRLWLLVVFVLCLAVVPDLHWALRTWLDEPPALGTGWPAMEVAIYLIERSVRVVLPLVCLLAIIGFPFRSLGLWRIRSVDVTITVALLIVTLPMTHLLRSIIAAIVEPRYFGIVLAPGSLAEWFICIFADAFNAVAEELAIWGVLYVCLRRLWHRNEWASLLVAALTFGSYHIYQGVDGFIVITIMGLLHGVFFRLTRRLWPLIIAHAATNISITLMASLPAITQTAP